MRHPNRLDWCWLLGECACAFVIIVVFSAAVLTMGGCASRMAIVQKTGELDRVTCSIAGEMNTGTEILCTHEGVIVRRNSMTPAITGAVEAAVKTFMHGGF